MTKRARLYAIKEIIGSRDIASQDDLRRELRKQGCTVTQATLSRDMKEIGVMWAPSDGGGRYTLAPAGPMQVLRPIVNAEVVGIDANESLIVIHTLPGCANTVGEFIDREQNPDIIGTVAGDNTLLVIPSGSSRTKHVMHFLKSKLIEGRHV
jgi:transcriptional regulator of arginine metabolism